MTDYHHENESNNRWAIAGEYSLRFRNTLRKGFTEYRYDVLQCLCCIPFILLLACLLAVYGMLMVLKNLIGKICLPRQVRVVLNRLATATTLEQYKRDASELDCLSGNVAKGESSPFAKLMKEWTNDLRMLRMSRNLNGLVEQVLAIQCLNFGSAYCDDQYSFWEGPPGSQVLLNELEQSFEFMESLLLEGISDGTRSLMTGTSWNRENEFPADYKQVIQNFIHRFESSWGVTALCLSGGGMMGFHHAGAVTALTENGALPKILSGTSAGSAIAAWAGSRTPEEIIKEGNSTFFSTMFRPMCPDGWFSKFKKLLIKGYVCDKERWIHCSRSVFGEMTFLEAYERTGRIINISVVSESLQESKSGPKHVSHILNYKSAPNVTLSSAVLSSSAFPFFLYPYSLEEKTWNGDVCCSPRFSRTTFKDGCLVADVPLRTMSKQFPVGFSIVSQVNPHVFPFLLNRNVGFRSLHEFMSWGPSTVLNILDLFSSLLRHVMIFVVEVASLLRVLPVLKGVAIDTLLSQTYTGDVTLVPWRLHCNHRLAIHNIDDTRVADWFLQEGKRMAFRKFPLIRNRVRLDMWLSRLKSSLSPSDKCEHNSNCDLWSDD